MGNRRDKIRLAPLGFPKPRLFGYLKTIKGRYDAGVWVLAGCMLLADACC
jgi:hypothetical protein